MSMLAERRRKTKWVVNPTKKPLWTTDSAGIKLGKEIMEKMGWELGKGLGQKEQGMLEPLKVSYKNDTKGMGFKGKDEEWIEQQDEFNILLSQLANDCSSFVGGEEKEKAKIKSLEEKSRQSKARVHYQKFTEGKDLSKYSANDLACILGTKMSRKNKSEQDQKTVEKKESFKEGYETSYGVTTIKSGFIHDYFNKKKAIVKSKQSNKNLLPESYNNNDNNNNNASENIANNLDNPQFKNTKKGKRKYETDELEVNFKSKKKKKDCFNKLNEIIKGYEIENIEISNFNTGKITTRKKIKSKHKNNVENFVDHVELHNQNNEVKKKKKNNQEIESKSQPTNITNEFKESENEVSKHSKNKRKKQDENDYSTEEKIKFEPSILLDNENNNLDAEYKTKKKKKKKDKKKERLFEEKKIELCENEENSNVEKENGKEKEEKQPNKNLLASDESILVSTLSEDLEEGHEHKKPSNSNLLENDLVNANTVKKKKKKRHLRNFNAIIENEGTESLEKINEKKSNSEKMVNFSTKLIEKDVVHSHKLELFNNKKKKIVCEKAKILKLRFGFEIEKFKGSNLTDLPGYGIKQTVVLPK